MSSGKSAGLVLESRHHGARPYNTLPSVVLMVKEEWVDQAYLHEHDTTHHSARSILEPLLHRNAPVGYAHPRMATHQDHTATPFAAVRIAVYFLGKGTVIMF